MMRYSVQLSDQIFVKGRGFLSFAKNMSRFIGKDISKNLSGRNFLIMLTNLEKLHLKLLEKSNSKKL